MRPLQSRCHERTARGANFSIGAEEIENIMAMTFDPQDFLRAVERTDSGALVFLSRLAAELVKHKGDELLIARLRRIRRCDYQTQRQWRTALMTAIKRCPIPSSATATRARRSRRLSVASGT
jgi:hypothetical protein